MAHHIHAECPVGRSVLMPWPGWKFECDDPAGHEVPVFGTLCEWHYWDLGERIGYTPADSRQLELPRDLGRFGLRAQLMFTPVVTTPLPLCLVTGI